MQEKKFFMMHKILQEMTSKNTHQDLQPAFQALLRRRGMEKTENKKVEGVGNTLGFCILVFMQLNYAICQYLRESEISALVFE